jgi:hypothetical protein
MQYDEYYTPLWKAGEVVPAGTYVRVDDRSYKVVTLQQKESLPATFDGHVALYCASTPVSSALHPSVRTHLFATQ